MGIGHGKDRLRPNGQDATPSRRAKRLRAKRIERTQAKKPFRPTENPFPEKKEFRLGTYRITEVLDDYLVCEGFDPMAKNPASEYTPSTITHIKVAKPPLLLRTPWDGNSVVIDGTTYSYEYSAAGVRTKTWEDDEAVEQEEEQEILTPYFEGDLIIAIRASKNTWQDGMVVNDVLVKDEGGAVLSWVDLNVSGRHWDVPEEACGYYHQFTVIGGSALPTSGSQIWGYTIGVTTANVEIDFDMTAGELKTAILTAFTGLTTDDLDASGGPWPQVPLEVKWKSQAATDVAADAPPGVGTNTLNNNCWGAVWPVPAWGG